MNAKHVGGVTAPLRVPLPPLPPYRPHPLSRVQSAGAPARTLERTFWDISDHAEKRPFGFDRVMLSLGQARRRGLVVWDTTHQAYVHVSRTTEEEERRLRSHEKRAERNRLASMRESTKTQPLAAALRNICRSLEGDR
ncbi:hypothetical protein OCUBac02_29520 [Bosea sp. ANAM02]|nr:hypothetical protein OCUBac02_29520 [Bosea sp. ANAM02]